MSDDFKSLNYLLTIMSFQRSQKNRKGLSKHLRECNLLEPIIDDCKFCQWRPQGADRNLFPMPPHDSIGE